MDVYVQWKKKNLPREEFFCISSIEGVYVPQFYDVKYNDDGTISSFLPIKGL